MAKSRRIQQRERRAYKQWLKKEQLKKLRRTEQAILDNGPKSYQTSIEWKVEGPGLVGSELFVGVDLSRGQEETVVLTGTLGADGVYRVTPTTPGKYLVTARIS